MVEITAFNFDPRRALWPVGFIAPALAPFLLILNLLGVSPWLIAIAPLVLLFGIAPIADYAIGRDCRNVSPEVIQVLENDPYYRRLMHFIVPGYGFGVLAAAALATNASFTALQWVLFTVGMGFIHSLIVLVAHELGHARSAFDRAMAQLALSLVAYGHFGIEHNTGHHMKVATPDDPASSRYNESIYQFALREIPGVFFGAFAAEKEYLKRRGHGWWSIKNELLKSWGATIIFSLALTALFGSSVLLFLTLHSLVTWFSITMANYTAHYGLLRRLVGSRREPCRPEHSWSSSFLFSNLLFFNLQRHSDHHANAQRPFQTLSHLDNTPELPAGIPGLFCMMLVPPIWFRVMNPRLHDYVGHDPDRINFRSAAEARSFAADHAAALRAAQSHRS